MSYYVNRYLLNLKNCYEKYFLSVTDDKAAVIRAMNGFTFPEHPTVNDMDEVRQKFFDHLRRELPTLMNKSNVIDFQTKADQIRLKRQERRSS